MARLINPFGGISAHGKFAGLVYERKEGEQYVKVYTPQRKRPSEAQKLQNYFFGMAADKWRELPAEEKKEWDIKARGTIYTGFNLYVKKNIQHPGIAYYGIAKYGVDKYS